MQAKIAELKQQEKNEDRQQRHGDLAQIGGKGGKIAPPDNEGGLKSGDDGFGRLSALHVVDHAQEHDRDHRPH